jgi:hypothetical protein
MKVSPTLARLLAQLCTLTLVAPLGPLIGGTDAQPGVSNSTEQIRWKPVEQAQVKLDDKTPLAWNVYQPDKKDKKSAKKAANFIILLLGHRYLMLNPEARLVYEVPLKSLQAQGQGFETEDPPANEQLIPSTDWSLHDVGPAELIRLTLGDYGRTLEVSIPHLPDMRPFY